MPKVSLLKHSFNSGEFSPKVDGRVDLDIYNNSCKVCENFIPLVIGGVQRRTGTRFVSETKDSSKTSALIPFTFSTEQSYILEFGDLYMRIYKDEGQVQNVKTITGCADNGAGLIRVTTGTDHFYETGQSVTISGVTGTTEANGTWVITDISATTYDLVGSTFANAYISGGSSTGIAELITPYSQTEVFDLRYVQVANQMWIVHPDHIPYVLTRTDHSDWAIAALDPLDGPYLNLNITTTTITSSVALGATTLTASVALFAATDVGRLVRIKTAASWGYVKITGYTNPTTVTGTAIETVGTIATMNWRLGVWSDTTGYPSTITLYNNRLVLGGVLSSPQRVDMSRPDQYESFKPSQADGTIDDDHAVSFTLAAEDVNIIKWLSNNEKGLFIGTTGGEWLVNSSDGGVITPATVSAFRSTRSGSAKIKPVVARNTLLFLQGAERKLMELTFSFQGDAYKNNNMNQLADHVLEGGVKQMVYQNEPLSVVWCVRNDGQLAGLTYERSENVVGWHRHIIGGYSNAGQTTAAQVEAISVIPAPDNSYSQVWMIVNRYIDGATTRYVEFFESALEEDLDQEDRFYVDSGLTYDGVAADVITGLDHLEGEVVQVLVEGATHPDQTVSGGEITLEAEYTKVQAGLAYRSVVQSNRVEAGAADGTAQGKKKRINRMNVLLYNTLGGFYGREDDDTKLSEITYRLADDPMDTPVPLFNGFKELTWPGGYDKDAYIKFVQVQPLPMTILGFMPQLETFDR